MKFDTVYLFWFSRCILDQHFFFIVENAKGCICTIYPPLDCLNARQVGVTELENIYYVMESTRDIHVGQTYSYKKIISSPCVIFLFYFYIHILILCLTLVITHLLYPIHIW